MSSVHAVLCMMGQFEFPPFCDLVSAVYHIQPKSPFNCKEDLFQMNISHCLTIEDREGVTYNDIRGSICLSVYKYSHSLV